MAVVNSWARDYNGFVVPDLHIISHSQDEVLRQGQCHSVTAVNLHSPEFPSQIKYHYCLIYTAQMGFLKVHPDFVKKSLIATNADVHACDACFIQGEYVR